ncbi:hypothetical protein FHN55_13285 [Streptomyces sp. NP160]|uniref:hypothetical protein n=1 Tax=Streptomyces sp. NP160 TaxID=2586637 RepID=UPI00111A68D5|nr:hypothetical protein [Streptomyces sp. NP160]TNM64497.1 hypothetical protein FHN55_13285 [Streptomyces sp. NP160]
MRRPTIFQRTGRRAGVVGEHGSVGGDDGIALVTVVFTMAVVTALALTALFLVVGSTPRARAAQDSSAALAAAQAGIDEYVSRLTVDDGYWTKGGQDASNAALSTPDGLTAAPGRLLPGTTTGARYKYALLNSSADIAASGVIQLKVVGTAVQPSGQRTTRTLIASLKVKGFLSYIYFSDVEARDPSLWGPTSWVTSNGRWSVERDGSYFGFRATAATLGALCSRYTWQGRQSTTYKAGQYATDVIDLSNGAKVGTLPDWDGDAGAVIGQVCPTTNDIQFTSGDLVKGPLHSNDLLKLGGHPTFGDPDTTVWSGSYPATGPLFWGGGSPSSGTPSQPGYAPRASSTDTKLPLGNGDLLRYVRPKVDEDPNTDRRGCLYRGATRFTFTGSTMRVDSPNSYDAAPGCLVPGSPDAALQIPPVIYVKGTSGSCTGVGYPAPGEDVSRGITTDYNPCNGTAFVSGSVGGAVTLSAEADVVVVGDTTYADGGQGTNVLGLVAKNYVWVYHPLDSNRNELPGYTPVHQIQAGILSLQHSFLVQNYNEGHSLSTGGDDTKLNILGALAQRYRGPVGTGSGTSASTGYLKNYVYDKRFAGLQPPYFIKPVATPWQVSSVVDAPAGS